MPRSLTRFRYLLGEAVDNIKANRTTTVIALATTTFTMLGMGVFLLLYLNVQDALGSLKDEIKVIVYLRDAVPPKTIAQLRSELSKDPAVAAVEFVSREQALATFRAQFPSEERLLSGFGDNPFPASLVVKVGPAYRSSEQVGALVQKLKALSEAEEVLYSQDWIENLAVAVRYLRVLGVGIGVVLAASMVTILANTIKLTLYARREEIEILKLVGATDRFVKAPLMVEGALQGALGAGCALALLYGIYRLGAPALAEALSGAVGAIELRFLPPAQAGLVLATGALLGMCGSWIAVGRYADA